MRASFLLPIFLESFSWKEQPHVLHFKVIWSSSGMPRDMVHQMKDGWFCTLECLLDYVFGIFLDTNQM